MPALSSVPIRRAAIRTHRTATIALYFLSPVIAL